MNFTSPLALARLGARLSAASLLALLVGCGGGGAAPEGPSDPGPGVPQPPVQPPGQPAPSVQTVAPSNGPVDGGTRVTIQGAEFQEPLTVEFGGVAATDVTVLGPGTVEAVAPFNPHGDVSVAVVNGNGTGSLADAFAYVRFPTVLAGSDVQVDSHVGTPSSLRSPKVCCAGEHVYVTWSEARAGASQDIFFQHSSDRGRSWLPVDVRLNTNAAGASASLAPQICCDDAYVYVCWMDNRNGHYEPYVNRSASRGATWLPNDVRISPSSGSILTFEPSIACDGQQVVVTWADDRNNAPFRGADIWANRSSDGGLTWLSTDARVSSAPAGSMPAIVSRTVPVMVGSSAYVTWTDWRNGHADVFFGRSADGGATWDAINTRLDTDSPSADPKLCAVDSHVYVVWRDARQPGSYRLYARGSSNGGSSFASEVRVDHAGSGVVAGVPSVACAGSDLYVAWADARDGLGADVWFNRSTDAAATFGPTDVRLNNDVGTSLVVTHDPVACCSPEGIVHVGWADQRNGSGFDVFVSSSADRGATWPFDGLRMDTDLAGSTSSYGPDIACDGALFQVVWKDDRGAAAPEAGFDIRANGNQP